MLDVQLLRENTEAVAQRLAARGFALDVAAFRALEDERKRQLDEVRMPAQRVSFRQCEIAFTRAARFFLSAIFLE